MSPQFKPLQALTQPTAPPSPPHGYNLGVVLRLLLGGNALLAIGALIHSPDLGTWFAHYLEAAAFGEPILLTLIAVLALTAPLWSQHPPYILQAGTLVLLLGLTLAQAALWEQLGFSPPLSRGRLIVLALLAAAFALLYFHWRRHRLSPAETEARLVALNARIRPHFLFNALNTALALIRARPQQAETALESLSDLFRAAMRDPGEWVSLAEEIALCEQYLALENLRLGERLTVDWSISPNLAATAQRIRIPPLLLQPLVENAVYHGIEPLPDGGCVHIALDIVAKTLRLTVRNPLQAHITPPLPPGNQLALANIRERLALYYDVEARLDIERNETCHEVRLTLPYPSTP